jgi:hypothetical protein
MEKEILEEELLAGGVAGWRRSEMIVGSGCAAAVAVILAGSNAVVGILEISVGHIPVLSHALQTTG